jgi:pyruvate,water dikinase
MPEMVDLRAPEADDTRRFGGKAAGLARLAAAGARVPDGFAVEAGRLEPRQWPESRQAEFRGRVEALLAAASWVAVRSSAPEEDGRLRSYAGLFETALNVGCAADALEAAGHCIASGDAPRVHVYAGGAEPIPVGLVVQRQVRARAAGVCFTRDPAGLDEALVLEAISGGGEQLVSGRVEPESWRVRDAGRGGLRAVRAQGRGEPVLGEPEAREIAREALALAARLGEPLDLEWARDEEGRLWWLQARPITALADPALLEVQRATPAIHDGPVTVWTDFNLRETLPDPLPPLVWSLWRDRLIRGVLHAFVPRRLPEALRRRLVCVDRVGGRLYWNLNGVAAVPVFGPLFLRFAGDIDAEAGARLRALRRAGLLRRRRIPGAFGLSARALLDRLRELRRIPLHPARALAELEAMAEELGRRVRRPLGALSFAELVAEVRALTEPEVFAIHRFVPGALLAGVAFALARWLFRGHPEAAARLASGIRGNPTTEMSLALDELCERARPLADLLAEPRPPAELLDALAERPEGQAFLSAFDGFLERNGQRGPKEFDLSVPRWRESPEFLLALLRASLRDPPKEPLRERFDRLARERRAALSAALAASPAPLRALRRWLARAVELGMPLREAPKHHGLLVFEGVRRLALELGSRLAAQGAIPGRDDVFFLDWRELEEYSAGRLEVRGWPERIAARREALARFAARPAADWVRSDGLPVPAAPAAPGATADGALRGTGVGCGSASGRVRVLHDPDPGALRPGEVLVVRHADPGWTPLFPRAAALVMEVGGLLCHAAVVARELGLPAVVGARDATRRLADGQLVRVDGTTGLVTVLAGDPPGEGALPPEARA